MPPALRPTKFKFAFPANPQSLPLYADHALPEMFLNAAYSEENPAEAEKIERLFSSTIQLIATQHEKDLLERCGSECVTCKKPSRTIVPVPTDMSSGAGNSTLHISAYPLCGAEICKRRSHSKIINEEFKDILGPKGTSSSSETLACKVCGSMTDTKRCVRCKEVAYCGKEHQKKDWKTHKNTCVEKQDPKGSQGGPAASSSEIVPREGHGDEEEGDDANVSFTSSGVFNMAGPGEPPRYMELSKEQVLAHLMSNSD